MRCWQAERMNSSHISYFARSNHRDPFRRIGIKQDDRLSHLYVIGKTGVGKTFLGAALAQAACRHGLRALCTRVPRLLHDLAIARADGSYTQLLAKFAKLDVLVLDDFLIAPLNDSERRDLLEVLEDRYDKSSTVITSQVPTKKWHEMLADPTIADAICDRVVHNVWASPGSVDTGLMLLDVVRVARSSAARFQAV